MAGQWETAPVDLGGTTEIAELLGVSRQRADTLSRSKGFPEPVGELAGRRKIWDLEAVRKWAKETGRTVTS